MRKDVKIKKLEKKENKLINDNNNQLNYNEQNNKNNISKLNKALQIDIQKSSDFINNSDFIRELIAFSKKRRLNKKAQTKDNSKQDINNKDNLDKNNQPIKGKKNKKINIVNSEMISPSRNMKSDNKQIITKNNTLSKFFNVKKSKDENISKTKQILDVDLTEVIEGPLFKKIQEPKEGHSKGIIQLIKYSKVSPSKNDKNLFDNDKYCLKGNKTVKYYNEQNLFDEPKAKKINTNNINNNGNISSSHHKILKKDFVNQIRNENIKKEKFNKSNENFFNNHNKTLSYNKYNNNESSFLKQNNLALMNKKDKSLEKNEIKKKNSEDKNTYKNFAKIKKQKIYKKINTSKIFNIINSPDVKGQKDDLQKNISEVYKYNKQKPNLNINNNIYNNLMNLTQNQMNSPILINKIINYRKEYLINNNSDDENLSKLNKHNYLTNDCPNNIENTDILKTSFSKDRYENINKKSDSPFYNTNNISNMTKEINEVDFLKTHSKFSIFNKFKRKRFNGYNDITINRTNVQNNNNQNILYLKYKNHQKNNNKSYYRNKTNDNFLSHSNDLNHIKTIKKNRNIITINDKKQLLTKPSEINSPLKSPNRIYKKPLHKNNFLDSSKPTNTINNNFIIYRDEINFISKENEINIRNENINIELYKTNEKIINNKTTNQKHFFHKKYYQYHLKKPKIEFNYFTKKYILYKKKLKDITPKKIYKPSICNFTKLFVIKAKDIISKSINQNKFVGYKIYSKKKNLKTKNDMIKDIKSEKKLNSSSRFDNNKLSDYKYKMKNINNKKNDIIFLLNIITVKNILNIENQLMKLIIISDNSINIQNSEENAKLFINDIISNIKIFIKLLISKVSNEKKFIELYIKLCSDLCKKYLNSINELILNKYLNKDDTNDDKFNIIINFKRVLNLECIEKCENLLLSGINKDNRQQLFEIMNFVYLGLDNDITNIDTLIKIMNNIFNIFDKSKCNDNEYYFLFLIIYFTIKIKNKNKDDNVGNFVEKIDFILSENLNKENAPKFLKRKIEEFINVFPKTTEIKYKINHDHLTCSELLKEDIDNYIIFQKQNNLNETKNENLYFTTFKRFKQFELEDILKSYINISNNSITKEEDVKYYKSYIKDIIEMISSNLSLRKLRLFHKKILLILSEINQISKKNIYSYEVFGYLIYLLISNELCDIKDMNIFINKDEESKINICKIIKYIILSSEDINKFSEDFKNIELFKNNNLFDDLIKNDLNKIYPETK